MFQLWVLEGTAASTLPTTHPESVAESFLHVGDVVVRRQEASRARVQVVEPLVGDLSVAQVLNPAAMHPLRRASPSGASKRDRSVTRESCAWSCGPLGRLFRGAEKSSFFFLE